jgi:hypothetical protein
MFAVRVVFAEGLRGSRQTADQQESLVVKLASKAARCGKNPCSKLWKRILRASCDEVVETLDAELLSAFISDLENSVGGDNEEITGGCIQSKALELRGRHETNGKLRLFKP